MYAIKISLVLLALSLAGCMAEVEYTNPNTGAEIKYTRWGDQKIEGLVVTTPDGTHVELNKQESTADAVKATILALTPLIIP